MRAKLLSIITVIALFFSVMPLAVSAAGEVTLNAISNATQGSSVTVTGTTVFDRVTVKVVRPDNTLLDFDSVAASSTGAFSYTFTLGANAATGNYTVVAGKGDIIASRTFTVSASGGPGGGGGGGGVVIPPGNPDLPPNAEEVLDAVNDKLDEIFANGPGNANGQGRSENAQKKNAVKAAENVVRDAGTMDVSSSVSVNANGVATVSLNAAQLSTSFKQLKALANTVDATLQGKGVNAQPIKVVATLNLGTTSADAASVSIPADVVAAAKEAGVDALAVTVNGVTIMVDVDDLGEGTTLDLKKQTANTGNGNAARPAVANFSTGKTGTAFANAAGTKQVAGVYSIEFKDADGKLIERFANPVTISLPVDSVAGVDTELLSLAKLDGGSMTFFGGKYNAETKTHDATRTSFSTYTIVENKIAFHDIAKVQSWAGRAIEVGAAKGIINGKAAGQYDPQGLVTRAEFATLLVKTFGLEDATLKEKFSDVKDGAWYQSYVAAAVKAGIVSGRTATTFDPNATITRAEMAAMAANALRAQLGYADVANANDALKGFKDAAQVKSFFKNAVALMASEGLIKGKGAGTFDPNGTATRAEAAVIVKSLFDLR